MVRNPAKLRKLLASQHSIPDGLADSNLTIVEGNVKDRQAVSRALVLPHDDEMDSSDDPRLVDVIVSGVGGTPVFKPNPLKPTLDDPTICEDATRTILSAIADHISHARRKSLSSISSSPGHSPNQPDSGTPSPPIVTSAAAAAVATKRAASIKKPLMVVVSTTGISSHGRDIPLLMLPLYHWMLPVPHADKRQMEKLLLDATTKNPATAPISGFVVVRPSLLTDGPLLGLSKMRVGWEVENGSGGGGGGGSGKNEAGASASTGGGSTGNEREEKGRPAIGYTISRADVGNWITQEIIEAESPEVACRKWAGKMVTLTY